MTISLTPKQEAWLGAHVASGRFASIEEAVRQIIDEHIAELPTGYDDDLAWAKPYVEEARAAVSRGEFIPVEEHQSRMETLLASLRA